MSGVYSISDINLCNTVVGEDGITRFTHQEKKLNGGSTSLVYSETKCRFQTVNKHFWRLKWKNNSQGDERLH